MLSWSNTQVHESHAGHGCAPGNASLLNSAEMVDSTCSPSEMVLNLFSVRTCTFHLELSGFTFWITSLRTVLGCPAPHTQFKYVLIHNILIGLSDLICAMKLACPFRELVLLGPIFRTNECLQWLLFSAQYFDWAGGLHCFISPAYQTSCQSGQESMRALASQM
jgi:hypothetical protein